MDVNSGEVVWEQTAHEGIPAKPHHIKNTLASETSATDGERLYAHFGNIGLFCYDLDGKLLWTYELERAFTSSHWTYGGKIFCLNEDGVTFAIQPGPDFKVLYTNRLAEDDMCMATPVASMNA